MVGANGDKDSVASALTKWVPVEVIAFYEGITVPFGNDVWPALWYAVAAGFIVTLLWTAFATEDSAKLSRIAWRQVVLSAIAFLFWVLGTTSPDIWKMLYSWWKPGFNPAFLAAGAVLLPITNGILRRFGVPQD